jgi:hypothetical protein
VAGYSVATYSTDGWMIDHYGSFTKVYVKSGAPIASIPVRFLGWTRVVVVFDASTHTAYVWENGVLVGQSAGGAWSGALNANATFQLGVTGSGASPGEPMADIVYDVGTAWSQAQVTSDYIHGTVPASVTHRWPLDDGAGSSARATLGGLPLTLSGGAAFLADSPMKMRSPQTGRVLANRPQNLLANADTPSLWSYAWGGTSGTDNSLDVPPPLTGLPVGKIVYDGSGTAGQYRCAISSGGVILRPVQYTGGIWMRVASGTRNVEVNLNGFGSTIATLTTAWQRVTVTATGNGISSAFLNFRDGAGVNAAGVIYVAGAQLVQANHTGDQVRAFTNNGPPRSRATNRVLA